MRSSIFLSSFDPVCNSVSSVDKSLAHGRSRRLQMPQVDNIDITVLEESGFITMISVGPTPSDQMFWRDLAEIQPQRKCD